MPLDYDPALSVLHFSGPRLGLLGFPADGKVSPDLNPSVFNQVLVLSMGITQFSAENMTWWAKTEAFFSVLRQLSNFHLPFHKPEGKKSAILASFSLP